MCLFRIEPIRNDVRLMASSVTQSCQRISGSYFRERVFGACVSMPCTEVFGDPILSCTMVSLSSFIMHTSMMLCRVCSSSLEGTIRARDCESSRKVIRRMRPNADPLLSIVWWERVYRWYTVVMTQPHYGYVYPVVSYFYNSRSTNYYSKG